MFLTRDPLEGVMERVASRNGYGYVEGNPVNYTDPSGMIPNPACASARIQVLADGEIDLAEAAVLLGCTIEELTMPEVALGASGAAPALATSTIGLAASAIAIPFLLLVLAPHVSSPYTSDVTQGMLANTPETTRAFSTTGTPSPQEKTGKSGSTQGGLQTQLSPAISVCPLAPSATPTDPDGCPKGSQRIEWPEPTWTQAGVGLGDSGSYSGYYDGIVSSTGFAIPKILTKVTPKRNNSVIGQYQKIGRNKQIYDTNGGSSKIIIHHKWPLFLDGPDDASNLVYFLKGPHNDWHNALYRQGLTGWMPYDPMGTVYCVTR